MDLDKAWLYRQGSWTEVDDPAAQFPEEIDNLFEMLHYNQAPRTYGVPGEHYVAIYYGPLFPTLRRSSQRRTRELLLWAVVI